MKKRKYGEITLKILKEISILAEGLVDAFIDQKSLYKKINLNNFNSYNFVDKLQNMQKSGYVKIINNPKDKNKSIGLTNKGKIILIEKSINKKTDKYWRMISFDIPEKLTNIRNQFRGSIKRIGFKQLQKSLWVCPYKRADEITYIIKELGINKYVVYLIVRRTDVDNHIKRLFNIKKQH